MRQRTPSEKTSPTRNSGPGFEFSSPKKPASRSSSPTGAQRRVMLPQNVKNEKDSPQMKLKLYKQGWFYIYCVITLYGVSECIWAAIRASTPEGNPDYTRVTRYLSRGWLPIGSGHMDNSDTQYKGFRNNIPSLLLAAAAFFAIGFALRRVLNSRKFRYRFVDSLERAGPVTRSRSRSASPEKDQFTVVDAPDDFTSSEPLVRAIQSAVLLYILHGNSCLILFALSLVNYAISIGFRGSRINPILTWTLNILLFFAVDPIGRFRFSKLSPLLAPLDLWRGALPDWNLYWRMSALRLISFNMDVFWASNTSSSGSTGDAEEWVLNSKESKASRKRRTQKCHSIADYSFINYQSYVFYFPLYLAGPIMTFNDYLAQCKRPVVVQNRQNTIRLAMFIVRWLLEFVLYELMLHLMFVVAISKVGQWDAFTPIQVVGIGYVSLNCIWLKLMLMWRFFRIWALLDCIDSPENMTLCMSMHSSTVGFWRHWHVSYNLWLVRYMYIPLGGSRVPSLSLRIFNFLLIFSFVAVWHDISPHVLAWGWLITLFIVPEVVAVYFFKKKYLWSKSPLLWRNLACFGGACNIIMMCTANLIGYAVGIDGMLSLWHQLLSMQGLYFMVKFFFTVFCLVHIQLEIKSLS